MESKACFFRGSSLGLTQGRCCFLIKATLPETKILPLKIEWLKYQAILLGPGLFSGVNC